MNPLGVHALVWVAGWSPEEAEYAAASTAAAGFDLLEIPLLDPTTIDGPATAALLDRHHLRATCSLGLSFDTDISSEDPAKVEAGEQLLHAALEVTDALGSRYLTGVIYSAMGKYTRPPTTAGTANSATVLGAWPGPPPAGASPSASRRSTGTRPTWSTPLPTRCATSRRSARTT